jgi:hypothetical protein
MAGDHQVPGSAPGRIVWVSYLRPVGFDLGIYGTAETSVEHLISNADAATWAASNNGAAVAVVVIVVAYMPGLDYDPAQILETLRRSCRKVPFVISVRENGPMFRPSHHAFTAEFREICAHATMVLDADSSTSRLTPQRPKGPDDPAGKADRGISIESRWDEIARQAVELAQGRASLRPPGSSEARDEAMRLVRAMWERGSRQRPGTFGIIHKRLMVALSLPGTSMQSADIAALLHYTSKDITNCYGTIAFVVRQQLADGHPGPDKRAQGASDFCKRLGRDYQDWLISFGTRRGLMPRDSR